MAMSHRRSRRAGLLLSFYLLLDAFGSFALAQDLRPGPGWGWMLANGVVDLILVAFSPSPGRPLRSWWSDSSSVSACCSTAPP